MSNWERQKEAVERDDPAIADTPFNMAIIFFVRLNKLLEEKDRAFVSRDLNGSYKYVQAVYKNIVFKISKKDREELKKKLTFVKNQINAVLMGKSSQATNLNLMTKCFDILDEVDEELMIIMDKHKMIFPRSHTEFGLEGLKKKYGI